MLSNYIFTFFEVLTQHPPFESNQRNNRSFEFAGGYRDNGAWTNTVEFFNFEKGEWTPFAFFPQLTDGRHYHGLTTLGLIPTLFGGWNNGSLDSIEYLDYCNEKWVKNQEWLLVKREHFAYANVPKTFYKDCEETLPEDE